MPTARETREAIAPENSAAYGGEGWTPRITSMREEIGALWGQCGVDSEWRRLRSVLLHTPGSELDAGFDPNAVLMLDAPVIGVARAQHAELVRTFRDEGVAVHSVSPAAPVTPNQMFVADVMFMTPSGAIVGRPASTVRAGEERWVARRLADLGVPILRSVGGKGTFEGADAMWLDEQTVLLSIGLRTNVEGAEQVAATLDEIGVDAIIVDSPAGTMHLMGQLRFLDRELAVAWYGRLPWRAVEAMRERGTHVAWIPSEAEAREGMGHNFVTLGPRRIVMPAGNPVTQRFYEQLGVECVTVDISELVKAAGAIGCLTGIVERAMASGRQ